MSEPQLRILYEDNHLLALFKPAGILTMGDQTGDVSMVDQTRDYLRQKYNKPGNVFVGVVHRLDRPVSGVLLFARTSKAAARLSDQFRRGAVKKTYTATVEGRLEENAATLIDWLWKDKNTNRVERVPEGTPGGQRSELKYRVLSREREQTVLEIQPITGRSHQIRVQLAGRGVPIVGDVKYGSRQRLGGRIRLQAQSLEFDHPTTKERLLISLESQGDHL